MIIHVGRQKHVGTTLTDYNNYLQTKRAIQVRVDETRGILEHLQQMLVVDLNFYYGIQLDKTE